MRAEAPAFGGVAQTLGSSPSIPAESPSTLPAIGRIRRAPGLSSKPGPSEKSQAPGFASRHAASRRGAAAPGTRVRGALSRQRGARAARPRRWLPQALRGAGAEGSASRSGSARSGAPHFRVWPGSRTRRRPCCLGAAPGGGWALEGLLLCPCKAKPQSAWSWDDRLGGERALQRPLPARSWPPSPFSLLPNPVCSRQV